MKKLLTNQTASKTFVKRPLREEKLLLLRANAPLKKVG